jgi:hypothetical protein
MNASNIQWFSLAMDERTDANDTMQYAVCFPRIDMELSITGKLIALVLMKATDTGADLYYKVKKML